MPTSPRLRLVVALAALIAAWTGACDGARTEAAVETDAAAPANDVAPAPDARRADARPADEA